MGVFLQRVVHLLDILPDQKIALEIMLEWRKQGIATNLISLSPVQRLTVNNNEAIIGLGFRVIKEDSRILYMRKH